MSGCQCSPTPGQRSLGGNRGSARGPLRAAESAHMQGRHGCRVVEYTGWLVVDRTKHCHPVCVCVCVCVCARVCVYVWVWCVWVCVWVGVYAWGGG